MRKILLFTIIAALTGGTLANAGPVQITAKASKAAYRSNEPVVISVLLRNVGTAPLYLSDSWNGAVRIVSVLRNGRPVAPQRTGYEPELNLASALMQSLRAVPRNGTVASGISSNKLGGVGTLSAVEYLTPFRQVSLAYSVAIPGRYDVALQYHFPALRGSSHSTYTHPTGVAHVRFVVR